MFKQRISSGFTVIAIVGLVLGVIGCTPQGTAVATATQVPATGAIPPSAATPIPATFTPLPITSTPPLPSATNLPPAATLPPAKVIDLTPDQVQTLDLGTVDSDFQGLQYSFTDGKYGYFLVRPTIHALDAGGYDSGKVARVDLQAFSVSKVIVLNLAGTDPGLKNFSGGFTVGQYAYFVPTANGLVARVDLTNFTNSGVTTLNLAAVDSSLGGFQGGFSDGRFAYFVPLSNGKAESTLIGKVVQVDLQNFTPGGVKVLDLAQMEAGLVGFGCGFTDGHYAYFMPFYGKTGVASKEVRVDLQNFTPGGVTLLDLAKVDSRLLADVICFTDGHYGYSMPLFYPFATRVDLNNFTLSGVTSIDLKGIASNVSGSWGGFEDGQYAYFNLWDSNYSATSRVARVDQKNFSAGGVTILNFEKAGPGLDYLMDGFSDGTYLYFESDVSGLVVRIKAASIPPM